MASNRLHTAQSYVSNTTDYVRMYLRDIGKIPLLTKDEEIIYGKRVKQMMALLNIKKELEEFGTFSQDEWAKAANLTPQALKKTIAEGEHAKDLMIKANLRLVVSIAKKYVNRNLELLDLIQEGSVGLHRGVEKFDPAQGYRFSTYAYWWIRQAMTRAIAEKSRNIRLPIHIVEKLNKIKKVQRQLSQSLGRRATPIEIANELDLPLTQVQKFLKLARPTLSIDRRVGDDGETELVDLIEDNGMSPEEYVKQDLMSKSIETAMNYLDPRAKDVLCLRFGLNGEKPHTLAAVGDRLNISRERVRQVQRQALGYLRKHHQADLQGYLAG